MTPLPLDFIPGTHGHFLGYVCNRALDYTSAEFELFTALGTSHNATDEYKNSRGIVCNHWYARRPRIISQAEKIIRITFDPEDLLIVNYLSLLRSGDIGLDPNTLHINTKAKLDTEHYRPVLMDIYRGYPTLDQSESDIPRGVLREFFKYSFKDVGNNGLWKLQRQMLLLSHPNQFHFNIRDIYDLQKLKAKLEELSAWLNRPCDTGAWLDTLHQKFLSKIDCFHFVEQCMGIVRGVIAAQSITIPPLNLLQESWINARLELIYNKEMPFHMPEYFTNTQDLLYYIENTAPDL